MHIYNKLLKWYNLQNINLPWRINTSSYRIWISEIMLQQTQVETVIPYYNKWMKIYPTLKDLSKADLDDLLYLWQGLGYYNRVKSIYHAVKMINDKFNGKIPDSYKLLISLNGIGDYTASAILAIAFKKYYIPVDGNIKRIVSRVNKYNNSSKDLDSYKNFTQELVSKQKIGDSVQALMDLGRIICKPKIPLCDICPIQKHCLSYNDDVVDLFPKKIIRKKIPTYNVVVAYILKGEKFLISKRPKTGLLSNLWELPGGKIEKNETKEFSLLREIKEEINIIIKIEQEVGTIMHQYSHFKVIITLFLCTYKSGIAKPKASQALKWINEKEKKEFAFPTATHKLFKLISK